MYLVAPVNLSPQCALHVQYLRTQHGTNNNVYHMYTIFEVNRRTDGRTDDGEFNSIGCGGSAQIVKATNGGQSKIRKLAFRSPWWP